MPTTVPHLHKVRYGHVMELCSHHKGAAELRLPTQKDTHAIVVQMSRSRTVCMMSSNKCVTFKGWTHRHDTFD